MEDIFRKGKFELLALTETKIKENGKVPWGNVRSVSASVMEIERAREDETVLLNYMGTGLRLTLDVLALEFYGLNSSFLELKYVLLYCVALLREMLKKGRGSGMT